MYSLRWGHTALLLAAAVLAWPLTARSAESYDNCAGFIDSLPATISTQGTWCLRHNLGTALSSGNAITIATNNVTIDCNDFKIGGLAAGDSSTANGIYAENRQNASVRHCGIRGFHYGILLSGGAGHLIEDNRLDNNLNSGIYALGDNNRVQRNRVYDTGGSPNSIFSYGIRANGDVIDNTVSGVFATATDTSPQGIIVFGNGSEARGNQVRGLVGTGSVFAAVGIGTIGSDIVLADNRISAVGATVGYGISGSTDTFCTGNIVTRFTTAYSGCTHTFGNLPVPL